MEEREEALWALASRLGEVLVEPFRQNYDDLVRAARARLDPEDFARRPDAE